MILLVWLGSAVLAAMIASGKRRSSLGWLLLGSVFGPIAVLAAAVMSADASQATRAGLQSGKLRRCPHCAEPVQREASRCAHCSCDIAPLPPRPIDLAFKPWSSSRSQGE